MGLLEILKAQSNREYNKDELNTEATVWHVSIRGALQFLGFTAANIVANEDNWTVGGTAYQFDAGATHSVGLC